MPKMNVLVSNALYTFITAMAGYFTASFFASQKYDEAYFAIIVTIHIIITRYDHVQHEGAKNESA